MIIAESIETATEREYYYQVVEVQGSEVGLMVALTPKFDVKGDAYYHLDKIRAERDYGLNPFGFRVEINVTVKED